MNDERSQWREVLEAGNLRTRNRASSALKKLTRRRCRREDQSDGVPPVRDSGSRGFHWHRRIEPHTTGDYGFQLIQATRPTFRNQGSGLSTKKKSKRAISHFCNFCDAARKPRRFHVSEIPHRPTGHIRTPWLCVLASASVPVLTKSADSQCNPRFLRTMHTYRWRSYSPSVFPRHAPQLCSDGIPNHRSTRAISLRNSTRRPALASHTNARPGRATAPDLQS